MGQRQIEKRGPRSRGPSTRHVEKRDVLHELERCECRLVPSAVDNARVLEDLGEARGTGIGAVQDRFHRMHRGRLVVGLGRAEIGLRTLEPVEDG